MLTRKRMYREQYVLEEKKATQHRRGTLEIRERGKEGHVRVGTPSEKEKRNAAMRGWGGATNSPKPGSSKTSQGSNPTIKVYI